MKLLVRFWRELELRGVRAAVVTYAVVGFIVLLLADVADLILRLPSWLHPLLIKTVLIGFPITVILAWHFDLRRDIRPVGGRDLNAIDEEERLRARSLWKMTALVVGVLTITFTAGAFRTIRELAPDVEALRIVIVPLDNRTGDPANNELGELAADWISQRLIQTRQIQVVPAASVTAYRATRGVSQQMRERSIALARGVGAGLVVWGTYHRQGDSLRVNAQILDSRNGDVVRDIAPFAMAMQRAHAELTRLGEHISFAVARHYGARLHTWPPSLRIPPSFEAHASLRRAFERYAAGDRDGSLALFQEAATLDTNFILPRIWQARVMAEGGLGGLADSIAQSLEPYRGSLTSYDAALLNHTVAQARADTELRYAASTVLATIAPASDDAVRLLAIDALAMNHPREARGLLEVLNPRQGWLHGWPGYYGYLGVAQHMVANYREELRVAESGIRRFPRAIEPWLTRCRAQAAMRDVRKAYETADSMLRLPYDAAHDLLDPGSALLICAQEMGAHGEEVGMRAVADRAHAWLASHPASKNEQRANYALALFLIGRPNESYAVMRHIVTRGADARETALLRAKLARIAALTGRKEEAAALAQEAAALPEGLTAARITLERAHVAIALGDARLGFILLRDAVREGLPHADPYHPLLHAEYEFARISARSPFRALLQPRG